MKKIAVLYSDYSPIIDAIKYSIEDCEVDCVNELDINTKYDLVALVNYKEVFEGDAIKCHHSLLPAFDSNEPEKDAILFGAKVTGITFYYTKTNKIISQYPIFITNSMHYEDLKQQTSYLEQIIYPILLQKIIKNELFEIYNIMNKGCHGDCGSLHGGCKSCKY